MRLSLRPTVMVGILTLIVMMVGQSVLGIVILRDTRETSSALAFGTMPTIRLLGEIALEATQYRLRGMRHAAEDNPAKLGNIEEHIDSALDQLGTHFVRRVALLGDDRQRQLWRDFVDDWGGYVLRQEAALAASRQGDKGQALEMIVEAAPAFAGAMRHLTLAIEDLDLRSAEAAAAVQNSYEKALTTVLASGAFAMICGFTVWFAVVHGPVEMLGRLTAAMREVADGRFTVRIPGLDRTDEIGAMARGLVFFRDKLADAELMREQQQSLDLANLKMMNAAQEQLAFQADLLDREVAEKKAELIAREREIVWRLARATERRDNETGDHIFRMSRISGLIAEALGMSEEDCNLVEIASQMHDIGKVGIPDQILFKPGPLTPEERRIMETHALIGWNILKGSESRLIRMAADVAGCHHEKWDGTGYPNRLAGEDIPICGRITALADVFDALMSRRPYKEPWPIDKARAFVLENSGKHFDPACVAAFMAKWDEIVAIAGTSAVDAGALWAASAA